MQLPGRTHPGQEEVETRVRRRFDGSSLTVQGSFLFDELHKDPWWPWVQDHFWAGSKNELDRIRLSASKLSWLGRPKPATPAPTLVIGTIWPR